MNGNAVEVELRKILNETRNHFDCGQRRVTESVRARECSDQAAFGIVTLAAVCWVAWWIEDLVSGSGPSKGGVGWEGNAAKDTVRVE